MTLDEFATAVGSSGPVRVVGGRTQWGEGRTPAQAGSSIGGMSRRQTWIGETSVHEVSAPTGIRSFAPDEMTVRVGAGTTVADLDLALEAAGQWVALPAWFGATVGGVLSVGHSGIRRLGYGPVRDTLLEARVVGAHGRIVRAGGPTVKNVSGFDLCRLLVGSLGTLALLGEVVLRTRPRPEVAVWRRGIGDPFRALAELHRPTSLLWDGTRTWALLEGVGAAVDAQRRIATRLGLDEEVAVPPPLPNHRWSVTPSSLRTPDARWGTFVAEVGVGVVHASRPAPVVVADPVTVELHRRLRERFDPTGRLNPGCDPLRGGG